MGSSLKVKKRPKSKLKIMLLEVFLNGIALAVFIRSIVYLILSRATLRIEVPAHYNGAGEVDRWGSKGR